MEKKTDIVGERLRASELFDYYGDLLKENQKTICSQYLLDDLSLSEIADSTGISRQGVHDTLKRSIRQMENFENCLHLVRKGKEMTRLVSDIREHLKKKETEAAEKRLTELLDLM